MWREEGRKDEHRGEESYHPTHWLVSKSLTPGLRVSVDNFFAGNLYLPFPWMAFYCHYGMLNLWQTWALSFHMLRGLFRCLFKNLKQYVLVGGGGEDQEKLISGPPAKALAHEEAFSWGCVLIPQYVFRLPSLWVLVRTSLGKEWERSSLWRDQRGEEWEAVVNPRLRWGGSTVCFKLFKLPWSLNLFVLSIALFTLGPSEPL